MKLIYLLAMLACVPSAHAQDLCKEIIKEESPDKTTVDLSSPYNRFSPPPARIVRSYSTDKDNPYDNFNIIFQVFSADLDDIYTVNASGEKVEKNEKKVIVEFDDKSKIVNDSLEINHDFSEDKTQSLRYAFFPVTDDNIKDFTTKKIVKISLAGYEQTMPDDTTHSFQKYLQCIKAAR